MPKTIKHGSRQITNHDKKYCFHCSSKDYDVKNCDNTDNRPKYFKYNNFEHIASKCLQIQPVSLSTLMACMNNSDNKSMLISICGLKYHALINRKRHKFK